MLLREIENKLGLTKEVNKIIHDPQANGKCKHKVETIIKQRVFGISNAYGNLNDHDRLRKELLMKTEVGSDKNLASPPTVSRFERGISSKALFKINKIFTETFINSYKKPPKEIILDFDPDIS